MKSANDILGNFSSPCGGFTLTFDDDGRVAYAYLKQGDMVVGDVWIYNRCKTPDEPEWRDRTKIPFANCKPYVKNDGHCLPSTLNDISVKWAFEDELPKAFVYFLGDLVAVVGVGDKPGHSMFASKNGPLAKVLALQEPA